MKASYRDAKLHRVIVENEGLAQDSLLKMVKILVMTVTGWGSVARYPKMIYSSIFHTKSRWISALLDYPKGSPKLINPGGKGRPAWNTKRQTPRKTRIWYHCRPELHFALLRSWPTTSCEKKTSTHFAPKHENLPHLCREKRLDSCCQIVAVGLCGWISKQSKSNFPTINNQHEIHFRVKIQLICDFLVFPKPESTLPLPFAANRERPLWQSTPSRIPELHRGSFCGPTFHGCKCPMETDHCHGKSRISNKNHGHWKKYLLFNMIILGSLLKFILRDSNSLSCINPGWAGKKIKQRWKSLTSEHLLHTVKSLLKSCYIH